jgi:hypothetical protein
LFELRPFSQLGGIDISQRRHPPAAKARATVMCGQELPVRRKAEEVALNAAGVVQRNGGDLAKGRQVPKLDCAVIAFAGQSPAIRRKSTLNQNKHEWDDSFSERTTHVPPAALKRAQNAPKSEPFSKSTSQLERQTHDKPFKWNRKMLRAVSPRANIQSTT